MHRLGTLSALAGSLITAWASTLSAQELPLLRDYPGDGAFECPALPTPAAPDQDQRARATQLETDALEATLLGQMETAARLLQRATEVDPASADLAYQHARALESLDRADDAILEYCRALALGVEEEGTVDARQRLDALYDGVRERIDERAREAFVAGLNEADSALYEAAVGSFSEAIESAPDWPSPIYNRGVVYERLGRSGESLADYRRYLDLAPSGVDPFVIAVSERIGLLEGSTNAPSPTGALMLGLVPGMGHYYTGSPRRGTLVLALAGTAAAAGLLVKNVTVVCVNEVPPGQDCPPLEVHDEITERPLLMPAVGVAAAVTIVGAIDALLSARARRTETADVAGPASNGGPRLRPPSVSSRAGRLDLNLLRVTFR